MATMIPLDAACSAVCPRCAMGHRPGRDPDGTWGHGVDEIEPRTGRPVYAYPEPCLAGPLRELASHNAAMPQGGERCRN